ncbi:DUF255 domain-containing protein [Spiribacter sp. C176]|uniref:DUF255 domain-containing protein n=1 Tax=Spiribacter salilacus TaxID=2664894 RepID=A0A6N7QNJ3_9GAMM|nr:thioredoxin domain-containing protein [Spiribacter salilacus]MRH77961.1 DUF255 domain-containing protein [Spiribacter salilacus]
MQSSVVNSNRLVDASSPYLRQHADNPVHWQPWDEAALDAARTLNKPILLSIGYAACHWCHVMAHESFADPATAEQMNRDFINIKVDREERPDLDRIYQTAHQLLTGQSGGWPLTVVLTPDQLPFFSGTYFPPQPKQGMASFREMLSEVTRVWKDRPAEITEQNERMRRVLGTLGNTDEGVNPDRALLDAGRKQLASRYDPAFGGFGSAPKFPQPTALERLLREYARRRDEGNPDRGALHMVCHTLRRMGLGGIFDQIGGGFSRYAVDGQWMIPHFEKMLSDNALLIMATTDAWRATGDEFFARIARETADWALREMLLPEGGFATSLDADTSDGEGAFYLWTPMQVSEVLDGVDAQVVVHRLGLDERPNFEGRWHPQVHMAFSELAKRLQCPREEVVERWNRGRAALLAARDQRERPARDDKVLTAWNALMIRALARAGRFLNEPRYIDAAERAETFIRDHLWREVRLAVSWRQGKLGIPGFLDDHAFMLAALLELQQARWSPGREDWAFALADTLLEHFEDTEQGGFYFTADDHETLIQRPRSFADDALPNGNGIAAEALNRLGIWQGEPRYTQAAERTIQAASARIHESPGAHCALLNALDEQLTPPTLVTVHAGDQTEAWRAVTDTGLHPARLVFYPLEHSELGAWVCRGHHCLPKVDTPTALHDQLAGDD